jgi:hypothetical protein
MSEEGSTIPTTEETYWGILKINLWVTSFSDFHYDHETSRFKFTLPHHLTHTHFYALLASLAETFDDLNW